MSPTDDRPIQPQRYGSGQAVRRLEDDALLQGQGRFTDDLGAPGDGWLVFVRSPHAHAALRSVDAEAARALPGVRAVITGADLVAAGMPPLPTGAPFRRADVSACATPPRRALAHEVVRLCDQPSTLSFAYEDADPLWEKMRKLGLADTAPFAWNGSAATLPEQIRKSLINTMQSNQDPSERVVTALTAYIESLASPPSLDVLRGTRDDAAVRRGTQLFADLKCIRCHAPPTYTSPQTYNVGLQDQQGNDHFNPPSLRGVGQRAPYFHDNRATTLEDVFRSYGHQLDGELNDTQLADLLAFLRSL